MGVVAILLLMELGLQRTLAQKLVEGIPSGPESPEQQSYLENWNLK